FSFRHLVEDEDWTKAIQEASSLADEMGAELYFPEGHYLISDKIFDFNSNIKITSNDATLKLLNDIPYIFRFTGDTVVENIKFDFNNKTCLNNYGMWSAGKIDYNHCTFNNIYGRGLETDTNEQ